MIVIIIAAVVCLILAIVAKDAAGRKKWVVIGSVMASIVGLAFLVGQVFLGSIEVIYAVGGGKDKRLLVEYKRRVTGKQSRTIVTLISYDMQGKKQARYNLSPVFGGDWRYDFVGYALLVSLRGRDDRLVDPYTLEELVKVEAWLHQRLKGKTFRYGWRRSSQELVVSLQDGSKKTFPVTALLPRGKGRRPVTNFARCLLAWPGSTNKRAYGLLRVVKHGCALQDKTKATLFIHRATAFGDGSILLSAVDKKAKKALWTLDLSKAFPAARIKVFPRKWDGQSLHMDVLYKGNRLETVQYTPSSGVLRRRRIL